MNMYELMNIHDSSDATPSPLLPLFSSIAAKSPKATCLCRPCMPSSKAQQLARSLLSTPPNGKGERVSALTLPDFFSQASVSLLAPQGICAHKSNGRLSGFPVRTSIVSGTKTGTSDAWACQTGCQACNQRSVPAVSKLTLGDGPTLPSWQNHMGRGSGYKDLSTTDCTSQSDWEPNYSPM